MSRFRLPQKITYWLPLTNNGTGGKTWSAGVVVPARIANSNATVFTKEGKQQSADSAVYTKVIIPTGALLIEAEHDGVTTPVSGAQLVIKGSNNSSMTDMNRALI